MVKLPVLLDADDGRMLVRLVVYSLLVLWTVSILALALGFGWRLFLLAKGA